MQKINFKNLPSTDTAINASNLNLMQDNIESAIEDVEDTIPTIENSLDSDSTTDAPSVHAVNEKIDEITTSSYCTVTTTSPQTITSGYVVNLNYVVSQQGNFTLTEGVVRVGAGIKKVRVSGAIFIDDWVGGSNYLWGKIFKNTNSVATTIVSGNSPYITSAIASKVIDVAEGDLIKLIADSGVGGSVRPYADNTYLCVEKVE